MDCLNHKDPTVAKLTGWTSPRLTVGRRSYISFYAFDPDKGALRRKKIHLARFRTRKDLRATAARLMHELTQKLSDGWNPWMEGHTPLAMEIFRSVADKYQAYIERQANTGDIRQQTLASYLSYLRIFTAWAAVNQITYMYQLTKIKVSQFIDYVYVQRMVGIRTRNSYLTWLKSFSRWLLERSYLDTDPTDGVRALAKKYEKDRRVLPPSVMKQLGEWLREHNPHFLLAAEMVYYCFLRPKEVALIRINDISLKNMTVRVSAEVAKNRRTATVTLPQRVAVLMIDLGIFNSPGSWYIFGKDFRPGREPIKEWRFRQFWERTVRPALSLPEQYKFYSLKDTGITEMLRAGKDVLTVRDQARHSDISITNIYAQAAREGQANADLLDYRGEL